MTKVGTRTKNQPASPWAVFEALVDPHRDPARPWLALLHDEAEPEGLEQHEPRLVVGPSPWLRRHDARSRSDVLPEVPTAAPTCGGCCSWRSPCPAPH